MRISHVVENLNRGGLERVVIDLIRAQRRAGHQCQAICLFEYGQLVDELVASGTPVVACGKRGGPDLSAISRLRAHLRTHGSEILHTHDAAAHYYAVAASLGLGLRRIVNTRHGMFETRKPRREWLYRRTLAATDAVATVCTAARDDAVRLGFIPAHKALVVPNGIPVDAFHEADAASRSRLALDLGLDAGTRIVGTVGRLHPAKDQATLIRAFARVQAAHPASALVIVGDGALRAELERCAAQEGVGARVRFLGDRGDVPKLLRGMDVFALSSLTEGYSISLLEACATSLPIVATAVGGNAEIVRAGVNGLIVPPADPEALAGAIGALLADPVLSAALGRAGRTWAIAHGSSEAMCGRYETIYGQA